MLAAMAGTVVQSKAEIGVISAQDANKLIESADAGKRPVVLDTRNDYKDYFRGHLPTATHLSFDTLRGTEHGVPVQYLPLELTKALLLRAGVTEGRTHVIYATGDILPNDGILSATMVAHVLEKYGVKNIFIVDGGFPAWRTAGLNPTQEYFVNEPGKLTSAGDPGTAVTAAEVIVNKEKPGYLLVDARPLSEFQGQDDIWLRKGHIPGAISFHWARLMEKENTHKFRPFPEIQPQLEAAGITPNKKIMCYCGTSREGSLLRFYLKHVANYPNVQLYEGAWKEYVWLKGKSLPAETGGGAAGLPK